MNYNFDIDVAEKLGVNAAIVVQNLQFWIKKNEANDKHFHDGRYWTFNSIKAWKELFPFWSDRQIRKILDDLIEKGIIIKGNFNELKYDRTLWYAFTDYGISILHNCQMKVTGLSNRSDRNVEPIPDINTDINTDVNTDRESPPETTAIELARKPGKVELNNVVDEFNQVVSRLPKVTALTPKRRNTIQQRIKEHGRESVSVCFFKAGKSDFLCGINERGWVASFDWIMKSENFVKILEGNYDNKTKIPRNMQGALSNLQNQYELEKGGSIFD
ncbi:hypothetical protein [Acetobacterium woodii]|uniref:Bacteriophage-like protein n=1 Tax=Acetobacterium woodii (strain ATCC 29683 / DSM 1030 / JCM 2381 / KCTC 1655 / WB1) TaxID=931626 RepID=H6LCD1_ACEWD|nr:hypothetical protein [Acetobacterium woodii]AFA50246.1 bacteriophage-like protein [Acetobacterium woodii DSM 1030]